MMISTITFIIFSLISKITATNVEQLPNGLSPLGAGFVIADIIGTTTNTHPNPRIYEYPQFNQFIQQNQEEVSKTNITNPEILDEHHQLDPITIYNKFSYYEIMGQIGTPTQSLSIILDTGSSDLWATSSYNIRCSNNGQGNINCSQNIFDQTQSSSWYVNNTVSFHVSYVDGSSAQGVWGTDTVGFGGITLTSCSFGLALDCNSTKSILGLSFPGQESTPYQYSNVPQLLKQQGYINTVAYSLWLNDVQASTGTILFGGIDHGKYSGNLKTVPIVNTGSGPVPFDMSINMSNVTITVNNSETSIDFDGTVILDSGTTFTYLPGKMVDVINDKLNSEFNNDISGYVVPCDVGDVGYIEFNFSGAIVDVPISEFLLHLKTVSGQVATQNGKPICQVGVVKQDQGIHILGDTFLRSAYVVYNLDNYEISLANTVFNSDTTNIESI